MNSQQAGFSVIAMAAGMAVLGGLLLLTAETMALLNREQRAINQKFEMLELQNTLMTTLSDGAKCTCALNGGTPFNEALSPLARVVQFPAGLPGSCAAGAFSMARTGQPLLGTMTQTIVSSLYMSNIEDTGVQNEFQGQLQVAFASGGKVLNVKPVVIPQRFVTSSASPPAARTIAMCSSDPSNIPPPPPPGTPVAVDYTQCVMANNGSNPYGLQDFWCPAGTVVAGMDDDAVDAVVCCPVQ